LREKKPALIPVLRRLQDSQTDGNSINNNNSKNNNNNNTYAINKQVQNVSEVSSPYHTVYQNWKFIHTQVLFVTINLPTTTYFCDEAMKAKNNLP
jgi:hypothetical protein